MGVKANLIKRRLIVNLLFVCLKNFFLCKSVLYKIFLYICRLKNMVMPRDR